MRQLAAVVPGGHNFAIGACRADGYQVAPAHGVQVDGLAEDVGRLAHGADDIIRLHGGIGGDVFYLVIGLVEGGAYEVGHACVEDGELLLGALLDVEDAGDEGAALAHDGASQLEVQRLVGPQLEVVGVGLEVGPEVGHGLAVGVLVVDAKPAAEIDVGEGDAVVFDFIEDFSGAEAESAENGHVGDLGADMEMQPNQFDVGHAEAFGEDVFEVVEIDAELVFFDARGDVVVGVGVHVGIDAEGDAGFGAHAGSDFVDDADFGERLAVETENAVPEGEGDFGVGLAYAGIYNVGGGETAFEGAGDFVAAHTVGSQPAVADVAEEDGVGVGFHGVVDAVAVGEGCLLEGVEGEIQQVCVVIIIRSLCSCGQVLEWHIVQCIFRVANLTVSG